MKTEYLYILDYCDGGVYKIIISDEDIDKGTEELLAKYDINIKNVAFMFSTRDVSEIEVLEPINE